MTIERAFENGKIDAELKELGGTRPPELRLPDGFCLNEEGQLCAIVPGKKVKGNSQPTRLQVLIFNRIGAPTLRFRDGLFGISFTATITRSSTTEVFLTSVQCYQALGLVKCLAKNAVMSNPERGCAVLIEKFALGWIIKLLAEDTAIHDPPLTKRSA